MKTIGLIGGMSWESTIPYYQIINEAVKRRLGGLHSARLILYSVEFDEIERCQSSGNWAESARILGDAALRLEQAGAEMLVICTNTMHKVAPQIAERISIPILHIADATADALEAAGMVKVGLLGTKYTMTQDFYKKKLTERGFEVLIPEADEVETVNDVIFHELCVGEIREESRRAGLFTWNKPSYACLATRIPAGTRITRDGLCRTEWAEDYLYSLGFRDLRVRQLGNLARVQLPSDQMGPFLSLREEILPTLKTRYEGVVLDLEERNGQ